MRLEADQLCLSYGSFQALCQVSFQTSPDAAVTVLLGPSGGGKSTLLRVLGSLRLPDSGKVSVNGTALPMTEADALHTRRKNGFVFQGYNLFPHLSALENLRLPLVQVHGLSTADAEARSLDLLKRLGLENQASKKPAALSGGQQQRVAIARALAPRPDLLLLDEPTSALDPMMTGEVLDLILELAESGQQIILATHEVSFARKVADWVVFLENGQVMESTAADTFFARPSSTQAQAYLDSLSRYR